MNVILLGCRFCVAAVVACFVSPLSAVSPTPAELSESQRWAKMFDDMPAPEKSQPFFSFTYDGKPSGELLGTWKKEQTGRNLDENRTQRTNVWTDPKTGLEVRCVSVAYADYPVLEWTVYFKNTGKTDTPILEGILGLDVSFHREGEGDYVLRTTRDDDCSAASYQPTEEKFAKGASHRFAPSGGCATCAAYPFFNVEWSGQGAIVVLGWPGQWAAQFDCDDSNALKVRGSQELTKTKLLPGEEIRSPLSVLMFWKGDVIRSQNLWRRWMIAHNLPRAKGKLPPPLVASMGPSGIACLPNANTEIEAIDAYLKIGAKFDYWWMDACWYPCKGVWQNTGTWEPDATRFPKGIKEVVDHAHAKGMKFVLWFEPERAGPESWLTKNHPDWIFGGEGGGVVNMGNADARNWAIDHFSSLIEKQGVDFYREDYNVSPLGTWRGNDAPDRQGITENLYIQGKLAYWDALLKKFPNLYIDSCAGGGRRNDLETLRRAVPLLRSDYYSATRPGDPAAFAGGQGQTYGIASWVPYFGVGVFTEDVYDMRSHITPALGTASYNYSANKGPIGPEVPQRIAEWRAVAEEFYGDYYPLTKYSRSEEEWMAWQFNRPEYGTGMVQAFRRTACPGESILVKLQGLDADAAYVVTNRDISGTTEISGRELGEKGLLIKLPEPRSAALITYKKKS